MLLKNSSLQGRVNKLPDHRNISPREPQLMIKNQMGFELSKSVNASVNADAGCTCNYGFRCDHGDNHGSDPKSWKIHSANSTIYVFFLGVFSRNIHFVMISCFDKIVMKDRYKLFKEIATVVYRLLERLKDSR